MTLVSISANAWLVRNILYLLHFFEKKWIIADGSAVKALGLRFISHNKFQGLANFPSLNKVSDLNVCQIVQTKNGALMCLS